MQLLTKAIEKTLPPLYSQEEVADPVVRVRFFDPCGSWTWYVTEGQREGSDFRFFGLVNGHEEEFGYFLLSELQSVRRPLGLGIERDLFFKTAPLSTFRKTS